MPLRKRVVSGIFADMQTYAAIHHRYPLFWKRHRQGLEIFVLDLAVQDFDPHGLGHG